MNYLRYCKKISEIKTVHDLLVSIDQIGVGSIVIISENYHLVGIVSDGDIRRALINNEEHIDKIINKNPKVWTSDKSRQSAITHLKKIKRNLLPVINAEGKVVDVVCLNEINFKNVENEVIIMAGGLGTRLHPLTKDTPKPMLPINGKPILERILEKLIDQGFYKYYISINYMGEKIKEYFQDGSKWDIEIKYIEETKRLGTAGALAYLKDNINKPFIVMNGDIITDLNFLDLLNYNLNTESLATMSVYKKSYEIPFGVVEFDKSFKINSLKEKPKEEYYINMGIYVLKPEVLKHIPKGEYFDMPSLFQKIINDKKVCNAFVFDGLWNDVGHIDEYQALNFLEG